MKNRRFVVCAFILIAAMVVGVGYAALTDTLVINGDLELSKESVEVALDEDVYFTKVDISIADSDKNPIDTSGTGKLFSASVNSNDPDKIAFSAKNVFSAVGDTVTIVATIINTGLNAELPAVLSQPIVSAETGQNIFEAGSKTFSRSSDTGADVTKEGLPIGETCELTIVFKVKAIPTESTGAITVSYSVAATAG